MCGAEGKCGRRGSAGLLKAYGLLRDHRNHRVGRASGREYLPSEKERHQVVSNLSVPEFWALALPTRPGVGVGPGTVQAASWWSGGERGPFLGGLQCQGSQPWPRCQHCPWRRKNIPKKKPVSDEPTPRPQPHSPSPQHPGLCTQPGSRKPLLLGLPKAMTQGWKGEAGGCGGLCIGPSICLSTGGSLPGS